MYLKRFSIPSVIIFSFSVFMLSGFNCSSNSKTPMKKDNNHTDKKETKPTVKTSPDIVKKSNPSPVDPCTDLRKKAFDVLSKATYQCKTDKDCGCYNPIHKSFGCGGVAENATINKLDKIQQQFFKRKCKWPHLCGARLCRPKCKNNRCQR